MSTTLAGKVVVVTGAGAGLGQAYAVACAAHGATLVLNDVDSDALLNTAGRVREWGSECLSAPGSVASWSRAERTIAAAVERFGRIDALVANAGVKHEATPWEDDEESLRRIFEVNALGVYFWGVHAMRAMEVSGGGSIVTAVSGARLGIKGQAAYGATKGAVASMTAAWALECPRIGVRVNAISPLAETPMAAHDLREDRPTLGRPEDVAALVVALVSDETSSINGETFRFDGTSLSRYLPEGLVPVGAPETGRSADEIAKAMTLAD